MQKKINTLKELLPSSPFVTEQVGYALKFAQESNVSEEVLAGALDNAIYLAKIANEFSNPSFYAYKPIVCALLQVVEDDEKLNVFMTETNSVLVTLAQLKEFITILKDNTIEACTYLSKAIIKKTDLPLLAFAWMISKIKEGDRVNALQFAYITMNIIVSKFEFTEGTYKAYNDLLKAVDKASF